MREDGVEFNLLGLDLYVVSADVNDLFCLSSFASFLTGLLVLKLCGTVYFIKPLLFCFNDYLLKEI